MNQARCLSILGLNGEKQVNNYCLNLNSNNIDFNEAMAAKIYFQHFHPGLNRRNNDPINSSLNYGYSIIRSAIARSIVKTGLSPTFGIHHNNQYNIFNLVDDIIEIYRPMVDLLIYNNLRANTKLGKNERFNISNVLHNACMLNGKKTNILASIDIVCNQIKDIILYDKNIELNLPILIPIEKCQLLSE